MKVFDLARMAEISIEELVAVIVRVSGMPRLRGPVRPAVTTKAAHHRERRRRARSGPTSTIDPSHFEPPAKPPSLAELAGRVTLRELDAIVSHWVLAVVLHESKWNLSHAAVRLGTSRRTLRQQWRKVRALRLDEVTTTQGRPFARRRSSLPPPSLRTLLGRGASFSEIRDAVRRWFVSVTIAHTEGNRTHAAEALGTSRRAVRRLLRPAKERSEAGSGAHDDRSEGIELPPEPRPRRGVQTREPT